MNAAFSVFCAVVAFLAVILKGPRWAFNWCFIPTIVLVPIQVHVEWAGLPELACRELVSLAVLFGTFVRPADTWGRVRWVGADLLPLFCILSFSTSFGLQTDLLGFFHKVVRLGVEWGAPYLLARLILTDYDAIREMLKPLALSVFLLAFLAVYECRMASRLSSQLWTSMGFSAPQIGWLGQRRYGFLRAHATFSHPLLLATFFILCAPLMILWGKLDPRQMLWSRIGLVACFAGALATVSRGPVLVLCAVLCVYYIARKRMLWMLWGLLLLLPFFLIESAQEQIQFTESALRREGNTESAHYRIALLLIYGSDIGRLGWFGDPSVVGEQFEAAWSIDNSYLYMLIIGGWLGCGLFVASIAAVLVRVRKFLRVGEPLYSANLLILASFVALCGCMANVWFAADYGVWLWILIGTLAGLTRRSREDLARAFRVAGALPRQRGRRSTAVAEPVATGT